MHFWIDKRSQACGFNGRRRVPTSLSSGRRRSKPMVTPVHRFQSIDTGRFDVRRSRPHLSNGSHHHSCLPPALSHGNSSMVLPPRPPQAAELDSSTYLEAGEGGLDPQQVQLMRVGGRIKYGMWASFVLATISVAATKFYLDHKGTGVEALMLYGLGLLCLALFITCVLSMCRTKTTPQFVNGQTLQQQPGIEVEIPVIPSRDGELVMELVIGGSPQHPPPPTTSEAEVQPPPPPYHIAILLPPKDAVDESPPPSYEKAVR